MSGTNALLPVAITSASYGVRLPSVARTVRACRSMRPTRTPACSVIAFSRYQAIELRKMASSLSSPARTLDSMIRL